MTHKTIFFRDHLKSKWDLLSRRLYLHGITLTTAIMLTACTKSSKEKTDNLQTNKTPSGVPSIFPSQTPTIPPENFDSTQHPPHATETLAGLKESRVLCGVAKGEKKADVSEQRPIRLATFNMYGAFSSSLDSVNARIPMIAKNLSDVQADVIGIQEAEDLEPAGRTIEQLSNKMAEKTGETWYWCFFRSNPSVSLESDVNIGGGGPLALSYSWLFEQHTKKLGQRTWFMGDAILSRLPFGSAGARRISPRVLSEEAACQSSQCKDLARGESRVVIRAEILFNDRSIHFFNSHFYTNITSESHKSQTQQFSEINAYVGDVLNKKNAPVVVTCDCNSPEKGEVHEQFVKNAFSDVWTSAPSGQSGFTGGQNISSQTLTANSRIDFIFVRGMTAHDAQNFPRGPDSNPSNPTILWPSDHLGVVAGTH